MKIYNKGNYENLQKLQKNAAGMFNEAEKWELVLMWKWKTKKKKILNL